MDESFTCSIKIKKHRENERERNRVLFFVCNDRDLLRATAVTRGGTDTEIMP